MPAPVLPPSALCALRRALGPESARRSPACLPPWLRRRDIPAVGTAIVFLRRFYSLKSLLKNDRFVREGAQGAL